MNQSDPSFPSLHVRPAQGWLNDPNGVCRIDGRYHVFFQYNPAAPVHADVVWGHTSSTDLLHWTEHPVALERRPGTITQVGCWTGCIVDDDGVPTAVYTAVHDQANNAQVALARSDRSLITWTQDDLGVMGMPDPAFTDVRDPFVFTVDGRRYAIQGAGKPGAEPAILLYGCDRLDAWTELGRLVDHSDPIAAEHAPGDIWECPNLALIDGRWVLIISLIQNAGTAAPSDVAYLVGDLVPDGDGLRFVATSGGAMDTGTTFYAPQLVALPDRTLLWGWARETGRSAEDIAAAGWAGVLTYPWELRVVDGVLVSSPAAELTGLRRADLDPRSKITDRAFELTGRFRGRFTLSAAEPVIDLTAETDTELRVLVDGSLLEVFVEGRQPITVRAYPAAGTGWQVEAADADLRAWRLGLPETG